MTPSEGTPVFGGRGPHVFGGRGRILDHRTEARSSLENFGSSHGGEACLQGRLPRRRRRPAASGGDTIHRCLWVGTLPAPAATPSASTCRASCTETLSADVATRQSAAGAEEHPSTCHGSEREGGQKNCECALRAKCRGVAVSAASASNAPSASTTVSR